AMQIPELRALAYASPAALVSRTMRAPVILLVLVLAACAPHKPPAGRWEGVFESADTMVAARVEIEPDGAVRLSAPDLTGIAGAGAERRKTMRARLAAGLAAAWP